MSHTPGPLRAVECKSTKWDEIGDHAIVDTAGKIIGEAFATVDHRDQRPARGNAELWAAAPEMYEALKAVRIWIAIATGQPEAAPTLTIVDAAIAKAEGK